MKILVTGGAGYIGSHIVARLLEKTHEVTALDDLSNPSSTWKNLDDHPRLTKELRELGTVNEGFLSQFELIFHLAANASVAGGADDVLRTNVSHTEMLARVAGKVGVKRIVFSSSSSVYGLSAKPVDITSPTAPLSAYGRSKLLGEQILLAYAKEYGFSVECLRYFNVAGAAPQSKYTFFTSTQIIPSAIRACRQGNMLSVTGWSKETPTRSFVPVEEVVDANMYAAFWMLGSGITNIGSPDCVYTIAQVVRRVQKLCGNTAVVGTPPRSEDPRICTPAKVCDTWSPRAQRSHTFQTSTPHDLDEMILSTARAMRW